MEGDVSAQFESHLEEVWQRETAGLNEAWDRIRALVTRGNAAGAVASLTLLGSQQLVGRNPRLNVFWALVIFAAGLLALLVREFLIVWRVHYQRKGKVTQAVDEWDALGRVQPTAVYHEVRPLFRLCIDYFNGRRRRMGAKAESW